MAAKHKNVGYDVVGHIRLRILVPFLSLLPAISITVAAMGAEIQTKSCPVAFHVDSVYYLPTSLYIKCDVKEYNLSFPDFFSKENGIRESRFKKLVFAIRANDLEKCLSMSFRQRGMNAEQIQKHNDKAKTWVSTACSWCFSEALAGEKLEKLKVVSQFYLGNGGLFVFGGNAESSTGSAPFRTKLSFLTGPEGTFWWSLENPDSLESLLAQTAGQMVFHPRSLLRLRIGNQNMKSPFLRQTILSILLISSLTAKSTILKSFPIQLILPESLPMKSSAFSRRNTFRSQVGRLAKLSPAFIRIGAVRSISNGSPSQSLQHISNHTLPIWRLVSG
jgi:hypothetical protein